MTYTSSNTLVTHASSPSSLRTATPSLRTHPRPEHYVPYHPSYAHIIGVNTLLSTTYLYVNLNGLNSFSCTTYRYYNTNCLIALPIITSPYARIIVFNGIPLSHSLFGLDDMVIRGFHYSCRMSFHFVCCLGSIYVILKIML